MGSVRLVNRHGSQADKAKELALPALRVHWKRRKLDMVRQMLQRVVAWRAKSSCSS